jgi:hypothetical protein
MSPKLHGNFCVQAGRLYVDQSFFCPIDAARLIPQADAGF